jgi:hypothetical protein
MLLPLHDIDSMGRILDDSTGEKTCYTDGDDWDLDGIPNSASPPQTIRCAPWQVWLRFDGEWQLTLIPWSALTQDNPALRSMGIDLAHIAQIAPTAMPCEWFELWMDEVALYRKKP